MKKKYAAMILALPALAVLAQIYFMLASGISFSSGSSGRFWEGVLFLLYCVTVAEIPLYVWIPLGIAGFGAGTWLLLTSRSHGRLKIGVALSMLPVLTIVLAFFFLGYRGP